MNALSEISQILNNPVGWELGPKGNNFTADQLIDAYSLGKSVGFEQGINLIVEKLKENINKTTEVVKTLFTETKRIGFNPITAFVKPNDVYYFTILTVFPESEYLKNNLSKVYDIILRLESKYSDQYFNFDISLCNHGEDSSFDEDCVFSDGYIMKYNSK